MSAANNQVCSFWQQIISTHLVQKCTILSRQRCVEMYQIYLLRLQDISTCYQGCPLEPSKVCRNVLLAKTRCVDTCSPAAGVYAHSYFCMIDNSITPKFLENPQLIIHPVRSLSFQRQYTSSTTAPPCSTQVGYYDLSAVKLNHGRLKLEISRGNVERPIGLSTLNIEYLCELSKVLPLK